MERGVPITQDLSARRIIGFACHQAFVLFLLFTGTSFTLCALVAGFAGALVMGTRARLLFSRPLLYIYAVVAGGGALAGFALTGDGAIWNVVSGVLVGVPSALLLTAWGRAFDREPSRISIPEVFLGSLVGALVSLIFSLASGSDFASYALCILPLASVVNIEIPFSAPSADGSGKTGHLRLSHAPLPLESAGGKARVLSYKILAGTLLFGMAAGLMESHRMAGLGLTAGYLQVIFVLFGAFLIGALSLLLSDAFGRGAALNKSYRLAVFVMMMGVLLAPWPLFATSELPGEAVVLAGFLGLEVVLISLFLVLAELTGTDCSRVFSQGFLSLSAGYLAGSLANVGLELVAPEAAGDYALVALGGALILLSYVFLFTERDFDALSQIVSDSDSLEQRAAEIVENFGLSNREAEILAFALRGRTSERIAQELVISKSTVDTHLRRIYSKCNVHSRQELLDLAGL